MKLYFIRILFLFTALLFAQFANAETDFLNLGAYQEGDTPSYGEDIVVEQDEKTGIKWVSQQADSLDTGTIKFPVNLSGDFEIFMKIESRGNEELFLLTDDEYRIKFISDWFGPEIYAGTDFSNLGESDADKNINEIRLSVVNNIVKVYLNDVFDGKITLKSDQSYNQLMLQKINKSSKIYAMNIPNGAATTTPNNQGNNTTTNPTTTTSSACKAKYDAFAGRITIPCIEVPDAFGGIQTYYIEMQQQTGDASFDLDFDTVKPVQ